jgi:hypothetical protein
MKKYTQSLFLYTFLLTIFVLFVAAMPKNYGITTKQNYSTSASIPLEEKKLEKEENQQTKISLKQRIITKIISNKINKYLKNKTQNAQKSFRFNWAGFLLGFIPPIGHVIAYFLDKISSENTYLNSAWIGSITLAVLILLLILLTILAIIK